VWDFGYGFDLETTKRSGQAVIGFTVVATALTWLAILAL